MSRLVTALGVILGLWLCSCTSSMMPHFVTQTTSIPVPSGWQDGSYTGVSDRVGDLPTPQLVRATVDIVRGTIVTISVVQPPGWQAPAESGVILRDMLEMPKLETDTPPPVSNESRQLMRALDDALSRARLASPTAQ